MERRLGYIEQLVKYIKRNIEKGYTPDSLMWALSSQGYSRSEIEKAIKIANEEIARKLPPLKEKPIIKYQVVESSPAFVEENKSIW